MRILFFVGLFTIFLCGCSYNDFYIKERDTRNAFLVKPLIVPPNININMASYKSSQVNEDIEELVIKLLFTEDIYGFKQVTDSLPMDSSDYMFLSKLNADQRFENIREYLNTEYFNITKKNDRLINKILHYKVSEAIPSPITEYIDINCKE